MLARGIFGAVDASTCHVGREPGDADAEDLIGQNVVDALFEVGDLVFQTMCEAARDLTQEDTRLGYRIQERHTGIGPEVRSVVIHCPCLGEGVEHSVGQLGRSKDFITGEVRYTGQHVRVTAPKNELGARLAHQTSSADVVARASM